VATPDPDSLDYILQTDITSDSLPRLGKESWQPLFLSRSTGIEDLGLWCALLDDSAAERALRSDSWDLSVGDGRPGFSQSWSTGSKVTTYHRFGSDDGTRPLVVYREFHGAYPDYCEIDEEFRLYHDLAEDKQTGRLLSFDSSGREIEVVNVGSKGVQARLKYPIPRDFEQPNRFAKVWHYQPIAPPPRFSALRI
jgi:hypothetical protein